MSKKDQNVHSEQDVKNLPENIELQDMKQGVSSLVLGSELKNAIKEKQTEKNVWEKERKINFHNPEQILISTVVKIRLKAIKKEIESLLKTHSIKYLHHGSYGFLCTSDLKGVRIYWYIDFSSTNDATKIIFSTQGTTYELFYEILLPLFDFFDKKLSV